MGKKRRGRSYEKRVLEISRIYGEHIKSGLSNREIWLRYIYPVYAISERTFYNILNASASSVPDDDSEYPTLFDEYGRQ